MAGFRSTIVIVTIAPACCAAETPCIFFLRSSAVEILLHPMDEFQQVFDC
jgi:hypothetical protein